MSSAAIPAIAAADWGTTRLRVWLLDRTGNVLAERRSDEGLLAAQPDRFAEILERQLADMGAPPTLPTILCGMVGSRQGWVEAPYTTVPVSLADIFGAAVRVAGTARDIRIVPGLAQRDPSAPDVMRGEETQLAGAVATLGSGRHLVCMPGTHSKWVELADGAVKAFQTFMTGELFSVLSTQSILRHSIGRDAKVAAGSTAFETWCANALAAPGPVETSLFRIRAATLLQGLQPADAAAALSGMLIGAEISAAKARFLTQGGSVVLIASGSMSDLYQTALGLAGFDVMVADADDAVRAGLTEAARHLGMMGSKDVA
ncbi:2-dehydro-3-deoxygalactonokinase [Mesorhizobium sp. LHD-90]|uniref:2-dehydro-3-deoxygalactonokinase n=1 Tax=Mesorhizobium sp. LHD-90 TaxID=3071414 RepID=UPI0027DFAE4F|nr:2-dehydro-3-deoxygalactonokinase [Mesorhizobium sp. LHD-90]MDQ6434213.1 2-dehydro-3-deoxygalactonokinase [Mesorhizobium sp. LHD-90]